MRTKFLFFVALIGFLFFTNAPARAQDELPDYSPAQLKPGTISSVGSDSMAELVSAWVRGYKESQPLVSVNIVSRGSATAPAALIDGSADLGPMARPMKVNERDAFISRYGFEPTQIKTAYSAISVYVSKDNPLTAIPMSDLDRLYSAEHRRGVTAAANTWGDLGVTGPLANQAIAVISPAKESVPASYFRQQVLMQSDFAKTVMPTTSSRALLQTVAANKAAIAFGETILDGESLKDVKVLAIADGTDTAAVVPSHQSITDGSYPLARALSVYLVRFPGETVDPALKDFLRFVLSKQGQATVSGVGLMPLTPASAKEELAKLE